MPPQNRHRLRLYSNRFCPYAQRIHLVLDAKKIPYETININLANKPDWLFQKSPLGKIPALELDNGDVLYESLIIADYLDEKYPQTHLASTNPLQKAKDRILVEQFTKVINTMYKILLHPMRGNVDEQSANIMEGLETFEKELAQRGGQFFGGERPGMLDYMIWPWCERADMLKLFGNQFILRKDKYIKLMEWRKAMMEEDAVKKSLLEPDRHIKFLQSHRAGFPDYDSILAL